MLIANVPDVIILNELTAARLIVAVLRKRDVRLFDITPILPPMRGLLTRLAEWAKRKGVVGPLLDDMPDFAPLFENVTLVYANDPFRKLESWQRTYFKYGESDRQDNQYAMAYKATAGKSCHFKYVSMLMLEAVCRRFPERRIFGVGIDLYAMAVAYFGQGALGRVQPLALPNRLINLMPAVGIALAATTWVLKRIRRTVVPKPVFLLADTLNDPRDKNVFDELTDGGEIVLVPRNDEIQANLGPEYQVYKNCLPREGYFTPTGAIVAIGEIFADISKLYMLYGNTAPDLFYNISTFPFRRLNYRALFNRYRPRIFWGRDDYQVEHLLRRQELHRIGAISFGISHAVQGICVLKPVWRYISFDVYYIFARIIHRYYKDTWAADMRVALTGSYGFTRKQLTAPRTPKKAILVMCRYAVGDPEVVRLVRLAAQRFPDHEVWVQAKAGYAHDIVVPTYVKACAEGLSNVKHVTADVYDLLLEAAYLVTDASTVISEALQIGLPTLMIDVVPNHETCLFREFEGMCHATADGTLLALAELIEGRKAYPFKSYGDLYNDSGRLIFDIIREDMGLSPRSEGAAQSAP
jgi:hypothetical protein